MRALGKLEDWESVCEESAAKKERMADIVREVIIRRERGPRSPQMERALKRLIWRYNGRLPSADKRSVRE